MMRRTKTSKAWLFLMAVLAVGSLIASACGSDRDDDASGDVDEVTTTQADSSGGDTAAPADTEADSSSGDTDAPADTEADSSSGDSGDSDTPVTTEAEPEAPEVPMFGNGPWPCGRGDASGETAQGVTDDTIIIGVGDDRGFPSSPGLNQHQTKAVLNFIDVCNSVGGINGRQIEAIEYDAAIVQAGTVMQEACDQVFMLVGSGFSLDQLAEPTRVGCGLGAVPAWTVSADFGHGPFQVNAVPNPADQTPVSIAQQITVIAGERGYDITKSGGMYGNFSATVETWEKVLASYPEFGFEFSTSLEYDINGEADWTPFINALKDDDVEVVYFTGSCPFFYQSVREAAELQEFDAIWLSDANFYDANCAAVNEDGTLDQTFVRMVFIPFEEADSNQATADFIQILEDAGNDEVTLLGMQAVSNFLLWATGAAACGSDLTRDCVLDEINQIQEWTGHGLHVPTFPAGNEAPTCGILVELVGMEYQRVAPAEAGTYECNDEWRLTVSTPAVEAALLDENRKSTKYLPN